jgi:hypothetical protein
MVIGIVIIDWDYTMCIPKIYVITSVISTIKQ